jgi:hypothetical protein
MPEMAQSGLQVFLCGAVRSNCYIQCWLRIAVAAAQLAASFRTCLNHPLEGEASMYDRNKWDITAVQSWCSSREEAEPAVSRRASSRGEQKQAYLHDAKQQDANVCCNLLQRPLEL